MGERVFKTLDLKDEDGNEKELKVPEDFLAENKIEEGSVWKWR